MIYLLSKEVVSCSNCLNTSSSSAQQLMETWQVGNWGWMLHFTVCVWLHECSTCWFRTELDRFDENPLFFFKVYFKFHVCARLWKLIGKARVVWCQNIPKSQLNCIYTKEEYIWLYLLRPVIWNVFEIKVTQTWSAWALSKEYNRVICMPFLRPLDVRARSSEPLFTFSSS